MKFEFSFFLPQREALDPGGLQGWKSKDFPEHTLLGKFCKDYFRCEGIYNGNTHMPEHNKEALVNLYKGASHNSAEI
jgi:hypothetical protein